MAKAPTVERTRRAYVPDEAWLAKQAPEPILEPDLPIVDPHHHLWDHAQQPLPAATSCWPTPARGHNITATVFIDCGSMYRADGPAEMRPVGETEFVNGVAAMSASGIYGPTRACAGIVGHVDLTLGARARAVLEAHVARRQRPLPRHPPRRRLGRQPRRAQQPHQSAAGPLRARPTTARASRSWARSA